MKFVVSLAFSPPSELCRLAKAADESGFFAAAISDHVVHPRRIKTPYPYTDDGSLRWEPFTPWPDPWVAIGAMSAVTERLRFLSSVFVLPMRNPFAVAKAVGTAAVMSNNRIALGIGVGWMKDEFLLMEQDFHTRGKRTNEMIEVLRKLWAGGWVEHHGDFYDFEPLEMSPVPTEEIPIYVGGFSEAALKRAARLGDGWISDVHSTEELREIRDRLVQYRADSERADRPFEIFGVANDAFDLDGYKRLEEAGITHLMTMPWFFYPDGDTCEGKCDSMRRFQDDIISNFDQNLD
jgi:probable F420-dependent oxidoreductase